MWLIYTGLFFIIKTVASKDCVCVPYYQCTANDSISTDGSNVIDIRFGEEGETNSNGCQHYLDKCCTPPEGVNLGAGGDVSNNNNGGGNNGGVNNGGENNGGGNTNVQPPPVNTEYKTRGCGFRNRNGIGFRITGSQHGEANFGEFPWMVALITKTLINGAVTNAYTCGASLIDKNVVLTAAHCVFGKAAEDMFIRAGEWDTQTRNEPLPHQDRDVAQIIVHPNYRPGAVWNDYALLVLRSPVILQNNVDTICLPDSQSSFEGVECTATGWGKNEYAAEGKYQVILKSIDLPVVNNRQCETALRTTRLGSFFRLHESFMCAGGVAGKDTCLGDGGSPLVCPLSNGAKDQFVQVGIVSWGIGCGQAGIPGVYADVRKVTDWIRVEVFRILGQINQGGEAGDIRIEQSRNTNL